MTCLRSYKLFKLLDKVWVGSKIVDSIKNGEHF